MKKFAAFMLLASGTVCLVPAWDWHLPESFLWMRFTSILIGLISVVTAILQLRRSS
jgi:hypothetical protein